MNVSISNRLRTVAEFVPNGSVMADIGSDHAYLPVYLVKNQKVMRAVAGEVHEGPYQSALRTVAEFQLQEYISVRKGNGLEVIQPGEVSTVAIAGMGGGTILDILQADRTKLEGIQRLVLQPMNHVDRVREVLSANGWMLIEEELIFEDAILYEILVWEPSASASQVQTLDEWACAVGPVLLDKRHPLLWRKAKEELERLERALTGMSQSQTPNMEKIKHLQLLKTKWQEVLDQYGDRS